MRKVHVHRNGPKPTKLWGMGRLPVRQTLVWFGPIFIRIAP